MLKTIFILGGKISVIEVRNAIPIPLMFNLLNCKSVLKVFASKFNRVVPISEINFRFCGYGCWCFPDGSVDIMDGKGPVLDEIDG